MNPQVCTFRTIDEDTFLKVFRPLPNQLDLTASFDFGEGGCLFSAAGKKFRHVLAQNRRTIWTLLDGDDGGLVIESGMHLVNRLGYLVTENAVEHGVTYLVQLE